MPLTFTSVPLRTLGTEGRLLSGRTMKLLLILALFASLTLAQDKSKLEPAKPPVLADADKLAIKDLQLTIVAADRDLLQLQISYDQTKTKRDKSVAGLEALIEKL